MLRTIIFLTLTLTIILFFSACKKDVGFNRPPIIDKVTLENRPGGTILAQVDASDPDGDPITYTYSHPSKRVILEADEDEVLIKNLPELGAGSLLITVKDDRGGVSTKTIALKAGNQPPAIAVFGSDKRFAVIGEPIKLTVLATDLEKDSLTYSFVTQSADVAFSEPKEKSGGFVESIMTINAFTSDSVEVIARVTDNMGGEATTNLFVSTKTLQVVESIPVNGAYAMALNKDGDLFVTSSATTINKIDKETGNKTSFNVNLSQGESIRAMAIDTTRTNGMIYLGIYGSGRTRKCNQDGSFLSDWLTRQAQIHYIAHYKGQTFLTADDSRHNLAEYNYLNGSLVNDWGANPGGQSLINIRQIYPALDRDEIFIADRNNHSIKVFDTHANFLRSWNGSESGGPGQFNIPHGVAYDKKYNIVYVSDTGNNRILLYRPNGTYLGKVDTPSNVTQPRYIVIDKEHSVYVAYTFEGQVLKLVWQ